MARNNEIDYILSNYLIGSTIDEELSLDLNGLNSSHQFYWNKINLNPKIDHGIYETRG